jgi:tetratricopeptide (TPR) repeat protein
MSKPVVILTSFLLLGITIISFSVRNFTSRNSPTLFMAPTKEITSFHLGQKETLADALWIRVVQDMDVCGRSDVVEQPAAGHSKLICNNSWVYAMLDRVTDLAPQFRLPYVVGGSLLSILVNDVEGARKIFEKGLVVYPNDWLINYRAAYHYMYELKNYKRAGELYEKAAKNGAPPWVSSLAARMYTKAGQNEIALRVLTETLEADPESEAAPLLRRRIDELKAQTVDQK